MSRTSPLRVVGTRARSATADSNESPDDFSSNAASDIAAEATEPKQRRRKPKCPLHDPAELAAALCLARAVLASGLSSTALSKPGALTVIIVPDPDWVRPASGAWSRLVLNMSRRELRQANWMSGAEREATLIEVLEKPRRDRERHDRDEVERAMWRCQGVVGVAPRADWLPADLVAAADHRLEMSGPSAKELLQVASELTGTKPRRTLTEDEAARVTPRLLRLARRRSSGRCWQPKLPRRQRPKRLPRPAARPSLWIGCTACRTPSPEAGRCGTTSSPMRRGRCRGRRLTGERCSAVRPVAAGRPSPGRSQRPAASRCSRAVTRLGWRTAWATKGTC